MRLYGDYALSRVLLIFESKGIGWWLEHLSLDSFLNMAIVSRL